MAREHPLSLHRVLPAAILLVLGIVAFAALRGPVWYQRLYYPLEYADLIRESAYRHDVDPGLVAAMVHVESDFDPDVVSKAGAIGLMQLMPETAEDLRLAQKRKKKYTTRDLEDPETNIELGTAYIRQLLDRYGDTATALAAYNAGFVNADRWKKAADDRDVRGVIQFPETRHYVDQVLLERKIYDKVYGSELR